MQPATLLRETTRDTVRDDDTNSRIRRAIDRGLNVLVSAELSPRLQGVADTCHVDARGLSEVDALLSEIARALGVGDVEGDIHDQVIVLGKRLWEAERYPTLVLQQPESAAALALFGRLRDELWELPMRWLVVVTPQVGELLDRPPSHAFFDVTIG